MRHQIPYLGLEGLHFSPAFESFVHRCLVYLAVLWAVKAYHVQLHCVQNSNTEIIESQNHKLEKTSKIIKSDHLCHPRI